MDQQRVFLNALDRFISDVKGMPRFSGQSAAVKGLCRVRSLAVFNR